MAATEISMEDAELDAIMAELEASTAGAVDAPKAAPAPGPVQEEKVVENVAAVLEAAGHDKVEAKALAQEAVATSSLEDELEGLVAEVEQQEKAPPFEPTKPAVTKADVEAAVKERQAEIAAKPAPAPEPVKPEPKPEPKLKAVEPAPAPVAAPAPAAVASPNPAPAKKATLQHYIDMSKFNEDIKVSNTDLDSAMLGQASNRAYYGELAVRAEAQHARLKMRFEVREAELYDEHRKRLTATGEKVTEKAVENAVKLDPRWLSGKNQVIEAETIAGINKSCVEAFKDRRDMIIQLGANDRQDRQGQMRMMEHDDLRARALAAAGR